MNSYGATSKIIQLPALPCRQVSRQSPSENDLEISLTLLFARLEPHHLLLTAEQQTLMCRSCRAWCLDTVISSVSASQTIQFLCRPEECLQIFPITEHWIHWAGGSNIYLKLSRYLHIYLCFSCCPVTVQCAAAAAAARCAVSPIKYENMTCIRQEEAALPIQETRRQL